MDIGTIVAVTVSVILVAMLGGLFIWLTSGWLDPGPSMFILGLIAVLLFFAFGWILLIGIAIVGSLVAGVLFSGSA